jgi:bifunctional DNase/RNase
MHFYEMKVTGVVLDPTTYAPMVILKDSDEKNVLPIWVGIMEATAIIAELEKVEIGRPMTHDLTKNIMADLDAKLTKIAVVDLKDNVFYATLTIKSDSGKVVEVDSRPSDAIALAMRCDVPILVSEEVILKSRVVDLTSDEVKEMSGEELTEMLKNFSAEDFGKYEM